MNASERMTNQIVAIYFIPQSELNRRREQEFLKLKKDFDTLVAERDMTEASLRKRHQDAVNEFNQQLENLNKQRTK